MTSGRLERSTESSSVRAALSLSLWSRGMLRTGAQATPFKREVPQQGNGARVFWKNMEKMWSKEGWFSLFLKALQWRKIWDGDWEGEE